MPSDPTAKWKYWIVLQYYHNQMWKDRRLYPETVKGKKAACKDRLQARKFYSWPIRTVHRKTLNN